MSTSHPNTGSGMPLSLAEAAPGVTITHEVCRGGRVVSTLVHRDRRVAFSIDDSELDAQGRPTEALLEELASEGFVGSGIDAPEHAAGPALLTGRIRRFLATLDLPLAQADGTVRRLYRRGLRHAFRPAFAALGRIGPDQRTAILLYDVEGYDYAEIATMTGVSLGTVKSRIHRGRLALRDLLAEHVDLMRA